MLSSSVFRKDISFNKSPFEVFLRLNPTEEKTHDIAVFLIQWQKWGKRILRPVKFQDNVSVILVPSREEYLRADLGSHLWWNKSEQSRFQDEAAVEVRLYRERFQKPISHDQAVKELYQPEYDHLHNNVIDNAKVTLPNKTLALFKILWQRLFERLGM